MIRLEKVRVVMNHTYPEYMLQDYLREFIGMTGTLVWVSDYTFQSSVELDEEHSMFGKFARLCYSKEIDRREFELTWSVLKGDPWKFRQQLYSVFPTLEKNRWNLYSEWRRVCNLFHTKDGDPLPWTEVQHNWMQRVRAMWLKLGDIPIDDDERIEIPYLAFPPGTSRYEIWHWFEEELDVPVYELMGKVVIKDDVTHLELLNTQENDKE